MAIVFQFGGWCRVFLLVIMLVMVLGEAAFAVTLVPEGNRNLKQPAIPSISYKRTRDKAGSFEAKYQKIYALLQNDTRLRRRIRTVAQEFKIDPVHIAGAIIGEHTYNVGALDHLQTYYIKGLSWSSQTVRFAYAGEQVGVFVQRPQFKPCYNLTDAYALWSCREKIWEKEFRGRLVEGKRYPDNRFSAVFFQPFFAGQTFGLGQLNPLTALMVSDLVHKTTHLPKLDANDGAKLYRTIMDPNSTIPYIAAVIRQSIDLYRDIADFDISNNPGITATLYNIGGAEERARSLAYINKSRAQAGQPRRYPQENYYGWFVNIKRHELEKLF